MLEHEGFPLTAVSLFTGAGGLDTGFKRAGFDIRLCIELDTSAVATLEANGYANVWRADIADEAVVTPRRVLSKAGLRAGQLGLVIGGPPCQPFGQPGQRKGLNDPRGRLVHHFARLVKGLRPRAFVFENVTGILTRPMRAAIDLLYRELSQGDGARNRTSYHLEPGVLNAADFGAPQRRERVFVVGWAGPGFFWLPRPTHYRPGREIDSENNPKLRRTPTVREALAGLPAADAPSKLALRVADTIAKRNQRWHGK